MKAQIVSWATGRHQLRIRVVVRNWWWAAVYAADGSDLKTWTELVFFHPGGQLPNATVSPTTEEPR